MAGRKKKIIYGILAVLCFGILYSIAAVPPTELTESYDMVVLGDSILGQTQDETAIPYQVGEALDLTVFNGAMGGTCMGRQQETLYQNDIRDALSFVSISKSIVAKDFRMQKLVKLNESGTQHFPELIEQLSGIDFSNVKILLIGYGVNDYHAGEAIFSEDDPYNEYTCIGALLSGIRTLQNSYPNLRIVMVTPTYTWYTDRGVTCEEYVLGGNVLENYVNAELVAAEELGIEIIDLYHDVYPHDTWGDWKRYSTDGLHPNEDGRKLISQIIIDYLQENPEKP